MIHAVMVNLKSVVGLAHRDGDQSSGSVLYGTVVLVGPGTGCLSVIRTSGLPCDARPGFRTPVAVLFADKRNPPSSSCLLSIISCPSSVYRPSVISHLSSVSRLPSLIYLSFVWNATSSLEGHTRYDQHNLQAVLAASVCFSSVFF